MRTVPLAAGPARRSRPLHGLVLQHVGLNPPGIWAEALEACGVRLDVVRPDLGGVPDDLGDYDLVVALGGPQSACDGAAPDWLEDEIDAVADAVHAGTPFLGICLGAQVLARALGGACRPAAAFDLGLIDVRLGCRAALDPVFAPAGEAMRAFAFHGDAFALPAGAARLGSSARCANEAMRWGRAAYGLQFHLEASVDDVAAWLDLLPRDGFEQAVGDGGRDGFLERYAAAVPSLRDTAVGIAWRWLAMAGRPAQRRHLHTPAGAGC
jgi:GMP synthase-like glutamine amidotransferase